MPIDYKNYPVNWKTEIRPTILERDNHCCKFCGVRNHSVGFRHDNGMWEEIEMSFYGDVYAEDVKDMGFKIIKIVLTIAHLDHDVTNNDYDNLAALCQKCHNNYDKTHRKANSRKTLEKKRKLQKLF